MLGVRLERHVHLAFDLTVCSHLHCMAVYLGFSDGESRYLDVVAEMIDVFVVLEMAVSERMK